VPNRDVAGVRRVHVVAVLFERLARRIEGMHGPGQLASGERDLRFRDDAPRPRHRLSRAERAGGAADERLRSSEISELGERDAAKRERRRVVTQRNAIQGAERIARCERPRGSGDQRIHSRSDALAADTAPRHYALDETAATTRFTESAGRCSTPRATLCCAPARAMSRADQRLARPMRFARTFRRSGG